MEVLIVDSTTNQSYALNTETGVLRGVVDTTWEGTVVVVNSKPTLPEALSLELPEEIYEEEKREVPEPTEVMWDRPVNESRIREHRSLKPLQLPSSYG